jgi:hypothetical protein
MSTTPSCSGPKPFTRRSPTKASGIKYEPKCDMDARFGSTSAHAVLPHGRIIKTNGATQSKSSDQSHRSHSKVTFSSKETEPGCSQSKTPQTPPWNRFGWAPRDRMNSNLERLRGPAGHTPRPGLRIVHKTSEVILYEIFVNGSNGNNQ